MAKERTIVIGDVHGCLDELNRLLVKLGYEASRDRLIFVGDLINKGPDSTGVLKRVKDLGAEVILGNHEEGFLRRIHAGVPHTLRQELGKDLPRWVQWMESWPLYIEEDDFLIVHAGLAPGLAPAQTGPEILTKIRTWDGSGDDLQDRSNPPWYDFYKGTKLVIFGHWAERGLVVRDNVIGLDSGCVYGRQLSAVVLPERKIVQVDAAKNYCPIQ